MEKQKHTETAEASLEKQQKKLKNRKKLKYGGLATAITVIFVAVVVLVNVVVTQIGKRYPDFKLDLTTANLYAISDETLDYIRNMDKDVDIAISSDEATFTSDKNNKMIAETLSKYQGYSDRISVTYFDTTKDPDVLSKYQELYGGSIQSNEIIITSGSRIKVYNTTTDIPIPRPWASLPPPTAARSLHRPTLLLTRTPMRSMQWKTCWTKTVMM